MEPHELAIDEIEYELFIRNLKLSTNRRQNCILLNKALKDEQDGKAEAPASTTEIIPPKDELFAVDEKCDDLKEIFEEENQGVNQEKLIAQLVSRMLHLWNRFDRINAAKVDGITHYRVKSKLRGFSDKFGEWMDSRQKNSRQKPLPNEEETRMDPPVVTAAANTTSITATKLPHVPAYLKISPNDDFESMSEKYTKLLKFINDFAEELAKPSSFFEQQRSRREQGSQSDINQLQGTQLHRDRPRNSGTFSRVQFDDDVQHHSLRDPQPQRRGPDTSSPMSPLFHQQNPPRFHQTFDQPPFEYSQRSYRGRSGAVHKWRIEFKGDDTGLSLNDFLSQADHFQKTEGLTDEEMRNSIIYLLRGPALTWYRAFNDEFRSWEDLKCALRREFLPLDYEALLKQEIERRVQGDNETFSVFLASMEMLFKNLRRPIAEYEKIEILRRNMKPEVAEKFAVFDVRSTMELSNIVKQLEKVRFGATRRSLSAPPLEPAFSTPSKPRFPRKLFTVDMSEDENDDDDLECKIEALVGKSKSRDDKRRTSQPHASARPEQRKEEVQQPPVQQTPVRQPPVQQPPVQEKDRKILMCWNCDEEGHNFRICQKEQQRYFCFNCGAKDTTSFNCKACKHPGNVTRKRQ
jgi:hypothetical protein